MPKLKSLSAQAIIKIFFSLGFTVAAQKGSHLKLVRILPDNYRQTLTIPNHPEVDRGTIKAIYRQALRYVSDDELRPHFYTK